METLALPIHEWQESHDASPLDGNGKRPLVLCAHTRGAPREDLALVTDKPAQP
jgi:hypothetical protein